MSEEKTLGQVAYEKRWGSDFYDWSTLSFDIQRVWDQAADAVIAAYEARRWKAIESAPKDGAIIDLWVYWPSRDIAPQRLTDCFWNPTLLIWSSMRAYDTGFIATHWTPIPAPPKEADHE